MKYYVVTIAREVVNNSACGGVVESDVIGTLEEALRWAEARWDVSKETKRWTNLPYGEIVRAIADRGDDYDLVVITEYVKKES